MKSVKSWLSDYPVLSIVLVVVFSLMALAITCDLFFVQEEITDNRVTAYRDFLLYAFGVVVSMFLSRLKPDEPV